MGQAREGLERGKGIPRSDSERVAEHFGITIEEACDLLAVYAPEELLPERGYGLTTATQVVGHSLQELPGALNTMEDSLAKGSKAKLELCTENMPSDEDLDELFRSATAAGFHLSHPTAKRINGVATTELVLTKGSPQWALLIPLIPTALIVGLVAFGLVRIEEISKALLPLMITGAVGLVALSLIVRKPVERIAERAAERYLPKA